MRTLVGCVFLVASMAASAVWAGDKQATNAPAVSSTQVVPGETYNETFTAHEAVEAMARANPLLDITSSASGHKSVDVFLMPAELGMPGTLSLPTGDGQIYTAVVLEVYANGRSEQVDFVNLANEHSKAPLDDDEIGSASDADGNLDYVVRPGIICYYPWRLRTCYWEMPNGDWRVTIDYRGDDGRWHPIIDTGYREPARSEIADEPPMTMAELWSFIELHAGHAPDVLAQMAAVLEEYAGSYLNSLGVEHPWAGCLGFHTSQ